MRFRDRIDMREDPNRHYRDDQYVDLSESNDVLGLPMPSGTRTHAIVRLNAHTYFDGYQYSICIDDQIIPLTARETIVIRALLSHPGRFISAGWLASIVERHTSLSVNSHCIEETIRGLRRKLGESGHSARCLVNRRGIGYAIIIL